MIRVAAAQAPEEDHTVRNVAMGVAAASPFGGLIGRKPIIHDPLQGAVGENYASYSDLAKAGKPGDILLMSKAKGSVFKNVIDPGGGSQFYHAQPVVGRKRGRGTTYSAGDQADISWKTEAAADPKWRGRDYASRIDDYVKGPVYNYSDGVLLRPKKPMSKGTQAKYLNALDARVPRDYDGVQGFKAWMRDMFIPKIKGISDRRPDTICEGNVCSTMPAMAYHEATGRRVVPNVAAQDTMPVDYLRAQDYELVGSYVTPETRALQNKWTRKVAPLALRAGIGAGLAGSIYAGTEDPALIAGVAGAAYARPTLDMTMSRGGWGYENMPAKWRDALDRNGIYQQFPTAWEAADSVLTKAPAAKGTMGKYLTRSLPLTVGTGALAYGAAKGLQNGVAAARDYYNAPSE